MHKSRPPDNFHQTCMDALDKGMNVKRLDIRARVDNQTGFVESMAIKPSKVSNRFQTLLETNAIKEAMNYLSYAFTLQNNLGSNQRGLWDYSNYTDVLNFIHTILIGLSPEDNAAVRSKFVETIKLLNEAKNIWNRRDSNLQKLFTKLTGRNGLLMELREDESLEDYLNRLSKLKKNEATSSDLTDPLKDLFVRVLKGFEDQYLSNSIANKAVLKLFMENTQGYFIDRMNFGNDWDPQKSSNEWKYKLKMQNKSLPSALKVTEKLLSDALGVAECIVEVNGKLFYATGEFVMDTIDPVVTLSLIPSDQFKNQNNPAYFSLQILRGCKAIGLSIKDANKILMDFKLKSDFENYEEGLQQYEVQ